jgi:hypothetical protein
LAIKARHTSSTRARRRRIVKWLWLTMW